MKELIVCVAYLRQKSKVNFRSTKVDAGKLKHKYFNRPWSTLAVKVLRTDTLLVLMKAMCSFKASGPAWPVKQHHLPEEQNFQIKHVLCMYFSEKC
jgi:hypothetical protein